MLREKLILKFSSSQPLLLINSMLSALQPTNMPGTSWGDLPAATNRKVHPREYSSCGGSYAANRGAPMKLLT